MENTLYTYLRVMKPTVWELTMLVLETLIIGYSVHVLEEAIERREAALAEEKRREEAGIVYSSGPVSPVGPSFKRYFLGLFNGEQGGQQGHPPLQQQHQPPPPPLQPQPQPQLQQLQLQFPQHAANRDRLPGHQIPPPRNLDL